MQESVGDLWSYLGRAVVAVTTHGTVNRKGESPMLHGCARQAREHFPDLPRILGRLVREQGNHVHLLGGGIVSFPVEHGWMEVPDPGLIARSAAELRRMADRHGWREVVVPRPGCGGGGLRWREVKPLLEGHFDGRFRVIRPAPAT